jgi:crossover junction endodeoxyribonuclease RusA
MSAVSVVLPYPTPSGIRHVRHSRAGHYLTAAALVCRAAVEIARAGRRAPAGLLLVRAELVPPDRRARDIDNVMKPLKDAITKAGFWQDNHNRVIVAGGWSWAAPGRGENVTVIAAPAAGSQQ